MFYLFKKKCLTNDLKNTCIFMLQKKFQRNKKVKVLIEGAITNLLNAFLKKKQIF